ITRNQIFIFTIAIVVLGLSLAVGIISHYSLEYRDFIRHNYQRWMVQASDSLYQIRVDKININVLTRNITIKNIDLIPDSSRIAQLQRNNQAPGAFTQIHVPEVTVNGIMWEDLFLYNEINVGEVKVKQPTIHIHLVNEQNKEAVSPASPSKDDIK